MLSVCQPVEAVRLSLLVPSRSSDKPLTVVSPPARTFALAEIWTRSTSLPQDPAAARRAPIPRHFALNRARHQGVRRSHHLRRCVGSGSNATPARSLRSDLRPECSRAISASTPRRCRDAGNTLRRGVALTDVDTWRCGPAGTGRSISGSRPRWRSSRARVLNESGQQRCTSGSQAGFARTSRVIKLTERSPGRVPVTSTIGAGAEDARFAELFVDAVLVEP